MLARWLGGLALSKGKEGPAGRKCNLPVLRPRPPLWRARDGEKRTRAGPEACGKPPLPQSKQGGEIVNELLLRWHLNTLPAKAFQPFRAHSSLRLRSALNHLCFADAATPGWLL